MPTVGPGWPEATGQEGKESAGSGQSPFHRGGHVKPPPPIYSGSCPCLPPPGAHKPPEDQHPTPCLCFKGSPIVIWIMKVI